MSNIRKEFSYDMPDREFGQTNELRLSGTVTYDGPAKMYVVIDENTNKFTGHTIDENRFETFYEVDDGMYAVEVDCNKDTLVCAIIGKYRVLDPIPKIQEEVPNSLPYTRDDPIPPHETYDQHELEYDRGSNSWKRPFKWEKPISDWEWQLGWRNMELSRTDRKLSEDLPENIYNDMTAYRQTLRNLPEIFGAKWVVEIDTAGSGYSVGDILLVSDPVFKTDGTVKDIKLTVKEVDGSGGIVSVSKDYAMATEHRDAATYNNVYYTSNSSGSGAVINLSKVELVDPWKITLPKTLAK